MAKIIKQKFKLPISEMVGVPSEIELNVMEDDNIKTKGRRRMMDMMEAIEFVEWLKRQTLNTICYDEEPAKKITENFYNKIEGLTDILKHGDRHVRLAHSLKKMWGELKIYGRYRDSNGVEYPHSKYLYETMNVIEQKYFPKGLKGGK